MDATQIDLTNESSDDDDYDDSETSFRRPGGQLNDKDVFDSIHRAIGHLPDVVLIDPLLFSQMKEKLMELLQNYGKDVNITRILIPYGRPGHWAAIGLLRVEHGHGWIRGGIGERERRRHTLDDILDCAGITPRSNFRCPVRSQHSQECGARTAMFLRWFGNCDRPESKSWLQYCKKEFYDDVNELFTCLE
jgi:hypothetical protein